MLSRENQSEDNQPRNYEKKIYHVSIPEYIAFHPGLSKDDLLVWWSIKELDNDEKHCHASLEYMAAMIERTKSVVVKSITNLGKRGLILNLSKIHKKRCLAIPDDLAERLERVIDDRRRRIKMTRQRLRDEQEKKWQKKQANKR